MELARSRILVRTLLLAVITLLVLGSPGVTGAQDDDGRAPVYHVMISGEIDLGLPAYLDRAIGEAEAAGATALIIEIDTPGGRLDAVIQMRGSIIDTDLRTIALVDSTAFSAGALVAISSEEIWMTPGSVMGAATPVMGGTGEVADEKTISAVRATFEAAAEENGRDPQVAAAMVDTRIVVEGLVGNEELLTLTVSQAVEFGYADGVVTNLDDLIVELGFDDQELVMVTLGFAEQIVRFITSSVIAGLLFTIGLLLIIGDLFSGGIGIVAGIGVVMLAVFFWGHLLAGLAGWEDIALVVLGLLLIAVEVFVLPGFGVAGILGLISLSIGGFLAMIYREFEFVTNADMLRAGLTMGLAVLGVALGMIAILMLVARRGPPSGLVLQARLAGGDAVTERGSTGWLNFFDGNERLERDTFADAAELPAEPLHSMVGATGTAMSDLRPGGLAEIDGQRVDVVTSGEFVARGEHIQVVRDERYRRVVRRIEAPDRTRG